MNSKTGVKKVLLLCVILILVLVMLYSGLRILESTVLHNGQEQEIPAASKTIERNGIAYYPRQDIKVMMILGIDEFGPVTASESYNNTGEADMVALLIFDEKTEKIDVLCLNRDTMLDVSVLGLGGKPAGTSYGQLALSHTYGSGLEDSCENTRSTVSNFLYGITIDYYVSMNMDAITILNDAVGGVTVNVTEDFSAVDPSIATGNVTLRGEQAIHYVQVRKNVGDQMNVSRMERQKQYMEGFLKSLRQSGDEAFVLETYDRVSDYIVTDCSAKTLASMLSHYKDYQLDQIVTPEGENVMGQQYVEFHVDEEKMDSLILELFYAPKN